MCSIVLQINKPTKYLNDQKKITELKKKKANNAAKRNETKKVGGGANDNTLNFRQRGEKKRKKKERHHGWLVVQDSYFWHIPKNADMFRKITRSPLRNHIGSHQLSVSESLTHGDIHTVA